MRIIRICLLFVSFVCVSPLAGSAQETVKINRVGFLSISGVGLLEFRKGLRDLGYEENKNLEIEERYANGLIERLPTLADELAKAHVSVIVTGSIPAALAAKKATASIPIVVAAAGDLVGNGLAASLQHPGGNITGIDEVIPGLSAKPSNSLMKRSLSNRESQFCRARLGQRTRSRCKTQSELRSLSEWRLRPLK
jgi:putative ABC transport system substrate-binding protein